MPRTVLVIILNLWQGKLTKVKEVTVSRAHALFYTIIQNTKFLTIAPEPQAPRHVLDTALSFKDTQTLKTAVYWGTFWGKESSTEECTQAFLSTRQALYR